MAEKTKVEEKIFTIPLRRAINRENYNERTKAVVREIRYFLSKHMKTDEIKISTKVNEKIWESGLKRGKGKIKVKIRKENDVVMAMMLDEIVSGKKEEKPKAEAKPAEKAAEVTGQLKEKAKESKDAVIAGETKEAAEHKHEHVHEEEHAVKPKAEKAVAKKDKDGKAEKHSE